jgi:hypothetical protein
VLQNDVTFHAHATSFLRDKGMSAASMEPIARSAKTEVYRIGDIVLRVTSMDPATLNAAVMLRLHELVIAAGVAVAAPVPELFAEIDGVFISGWEWVPDSKESTPDAVSLGENLRRLQFINVQDMDMTFWEDLPLVVDYVVGRARARLVNLEGRLDTDLFNVLQNDLDFMANDPRWVEGPQVLLHGDMSRPNVLVGSEGSVTLCDFERCGRGVPGWDVAGVFLSEASGAPWVNTAAVLRSSGAEVSDLVLPARMRALAMATYVAEGHLNGLYDAHATKTVLNWYVGGCAGLPH